jgi:phosphoribosylcarboxyaminoimidazole (NCAIR) mutase
LRAVSILISNASGTDFLPGLVRTRTGAPVVSWPYMPAALMPMPCWPRLWRSRWNLLP